MVKHLLVTVDDVPYDLAFIERALKIYLEDRGIKVIAVKELKQTYDPILKLEWTCLKP